MSYILDALRRAEAERERGGVPGLHAQAVGAAAGAPADVRASGNRWTVPALVVLVVAVVLLGWRPWAADSTAPATAVVPPSSAAAAGPSVSPSPEPGPVAPASPTTVVTAPGPSSAQLQPPVRDPETLPRRVAGDPGPSAATAKKRTASAASSPVAETRAAPGPASAAATEDKVYAVAELPSDIRQQLPAVTIGGSIYSTNPQSRFVIVNGQLFHEGDTLAPGLVLQQIRLKSAVLAFRGYRYGVTF